MLITLHLRIRIVATRELKIHVRLARERTFERGPGIHRVQGSSGLRRELQADDTDGHSRIPWLSLSPKTARRQTRRQSSNESGISELVIKESDEEGSDDGSKEDVSESEADEDDSDRDNAEWPSMINDPGRATPLQRRWLSAMSEGKEDHIARRFEQ